MRLEQKQSNVPSVDAIGGMGRERTCDLQQGASGS